MNLFDASALLAFLQGEEGSGVVEQELLSGGACSAVNWSETAQRLLASGQDWGLCLATAARLEATVWTADTAWGPSRRVRQIR